MDYVQDNAKTIQDTIEQKQASYRGLLEIMQFKITQQQQAASSGAEKASTSK
ncbi:hypothetical protein GGI18_006580 [Coemansia linderi]|nr:hypothetical protein GGI18_006580 [Coemansia linderi]